MLRLPEYTSSLRERFENDGYLPFPGLMPPQTVRTLREEVARLETLAVRRDFAMESMNRSPRHMTTLGGQVVARESELIPALYRDERLLGLLARIADLRVVAVRDALERHVVNILHRPGDTHGAHVDDYPLALVLFVQAPSDPDGGGLLEYVPRAAGLEAVDGPAARRAHHRPGDAYLLRSDTTAHRVTPLRGPGLRRTVLNLAYTTPDRQRAVTSSAAQLYCHEHPSTP